MECLFCQIASGKIEVALSYEDEQVVAFKDIDPQAPCHELIIPRQHIATLNDASPEHTALLGHMMQVSIQRAQALDVAESGYRVVANCNPQGGQSVFHVHIHLLAGRNMRWPPG